MAIEYRWFKNGKEAMYTSDLEGDQVTKIFWDNGIVKSELLYNGLDVVGKRNITRKGKISEIIGNISTWLTYIKYWDNLDYKAIKIEWEISLTNSEVKFTTKDREGYIRSLNGEPCRYERDYSGMVSITWVFENDKPYTINKLINEIPPRSITFDERGELNSLSYYNESPDALIVEIMIRGKDKDRHQISYRNDDGDIETVRILDTPNHVEGELNEKLNKFKKLNDYYTKKYTDKENPIFSLEL